MSNNLVAGPSLTIQSQLKFSKTVTGVGNLGTDTYTQGIKVTPAATVVNTGVSKVATITASGTLDVDLASFTDPLGDTVTGTTTANFFLISVTGASVSVKPATSNGLVWFWTGTSPLLTIPVNGAIGFYDPIGVTVDGTHNTLTITNLSGSVSAVVTICILGHSA